MNRLCIAAVPLFALAVLLLPSVVSAQKSSAWSVLTSSPPQSGRYEDISFISPVEGWAVAGTSTLIRTLDGGTSWDEIQAPAPYILYFRCLTLLNSTTAFIGSLSPSYPLIVTRNRGKSFSAVAVSGKAPRKVCGLFSINQMIYGVGGYDGAATLVRSADAGTTWTGIDMTPFAVSLVDVHFFNDSVGLTTGSADGSSYNSGTSVVLRTTNRGDSWEPVYKSTRTKEWGWKLFFINDSVGYVSIERRSPDPIGVFYLKTSDRGKTWSEHFFIQDYDVEGIGFIDESTGWIGGWTGPTYQSTDSGKTWSEFSMSNRMINLNRIRRINDTLMYGAGTQIFKYHSPVITTVKDQSPAAPGTLVVQQNYPNPFNPSTTITFTLPEFSTVRISVFNALGQRVEGIMDNPKPAGTYSMQWHPAASVPSGVYFYMIETERTAVVKSMIYLK